MDQKCLTPSSDSKAASPKYLESSRPKEDFKEAKCEAPPPPAHNIILVGPSGQGKSTVANFLFCDPRAFKATKSTKSIPEVFKRARKANESETKEVHLGSFKHTFQNVEYNITLIDTPGLDDSRGPVEDMKSALKIAQSVQNLGTLAKVIFVYKDGTKGSGSFKRITEYYAKLFSKFMRNNAMIIINGVAQTEEEEERRGEGAMTEIHSTAMNMIATIAGVPFIPTFFLNPLPYKTEADIQISNRALILNEIVQSKPLDVSLFEIEKPIFVQEEDARARARLQGEVTGFLEGLTYKVEHLRKALIKIRDISAKLFNNWREWARIKHMLKKNDTEELVNVGFKRVEAKDYQEISLHSDTPIQEILVSFDPSHTEFKTDFGSDKKSATVTLRNTNIFPGYYVSISWATYQKDKEAKLVAQLLKQQQEVKAELLEESSALKGLREKEAEIKADIAILEEKIQSIEKRMAELLVPTISISKLQERILEIEDLARTGDKKKEKKERTEEEAVELYDKGKMLVEAKKWREAFEVFTEYRTEWITKGNSTGIPKGEDSHLYYLWLCVYEGTKEGLWTDINDGTPHTAITSAPRTQYKDLLLEWLKKYPRTKSIGWWHQQIRRFLEKAGYEHS